MKKSAKLLPWKKWIVGLVLLPLTLFIAGISLIYWKQDAIVQEVIRTLNADFSGKITVKGSHIAPFASFPYISIDLEDLAVYAAKNDTNQQAIAYVKDAYIGFDLWTLLSGKMDIKTIRLQRGALRLVQHHDGTLNLVKAFTPLKPSKEVSEDFHLDLQYIRLDQFDISKYNEANQLFVDTYVSKAKTKFKSNQQETKIGLDARFLLTVMNGKKKTFLRKKHFAVATDISLDSAYRWLYIQPTEIEVEQASFNFEGKVDLVHDMDLDLRFHGVKSNFDLVLALAPDELQPTLKRFDNKGRIFFETTIKGKSLNGQQPAINARFGCKDGFFQNIETNKTLDQIAFEGSFSNGSKRNASTSLFTLKNFRAKPEAGIFSGKMKVQNFASPDIDVQLKSDFDLDFLAKFLSLDELKGLSGHVLLTLNFHDIIDIDQPEKTIERFNESYFTQLEVKKLRFTSPDLPVPIEQLDIRAHMDGHQAFVDHFSLKAGKSDLRVHGTISDLPAVLHHTDLPVDVDLSIESNWLDIKELTQKSKGKPINEHIEKLRTRLRFQSSARALTESPILPIGSFYIDDLHAKLKNYPHTLHDFHAAVQIEPTDFRVIDFSGFIDQSDFHFSGKLKNYAVWFDEKLTGDTDIDFHLRSKQLRLDNLFVYGGENYVPEDYRHEVFSNLTISGASHVHFKQRFQSIDLKLNTLKGKMKIHPLALDRFSGDFHLENNQLTVRHLHGKIGDSEWDASAQYSFGKNRQPKRDFITLRAKTLDWDQLTNFTPPPTNHTSKQTNHDEVFNIFDFEFPNLDVRVDAQKMKYKNYLLRDFQLDLGAFADHHLELRTLRTKLAGGSLYMRGDLRGKDRKNIYFKPFIEATNIDLDALLIKFDNFGQDYIVSDNIHGIVSGKITGNIHLHADLVPKLDDSELTLQARITNGRLEQFAPLLALGDYFEDRQLRTVVFDTLQNTFHWENGKITIPTMTIQSNLGYLELTGEQWVNDKMDMNYTIGVPWKLVNQVAGKKLFKRKTNEEAPDEIKYRTENARLLYVRISGNTTHYDVKLGKRK